MTRKLEQALIVILAAMLSGCESKSTAEWIEQLHSKDSAQRLHAVKALADRHQEASVVVPILAEALKDTDAFVRRDVAAALGKIGPDAKPAVPALLAAQGDKNASVRTQVARALQQIDPDSMRKSKKM
jgi:HEAT repeat protein